MRQSLAGAGGTFGRPMQSGTALTAHSAATLSGAQTHAQLRPSDMS